MSCSGLHNPKHSLCIYCSSRAHGRQQLHSAEVPSKACNLVILHSGSDLERTML